MNCVRFLAALLAVCILIMPAFSFEDKGYPDQKKCDFQKPCDIPQPMMKDDGKKIICECKVKEEKKPCDEKKTCEDQKPMMGDQGQNDQQNN